MIPLRIVVPTLLACTAIGVVPSLSADRPALPMPASQVEPIADPVANPAPAEPVVVEVAILLDTSSSMDGLIDQARTRLWSIINDLATATKNGQAPDIRVALYEYGKSSLADDSLWISQAVPLTDDLDAVSEALFALTTNGGDEYCGAVIQRAVHDLEWTDGDHYRAIFIAGNEAFTQGPVDYRSVIPTAIADGIVVNTIHCGAASAGVAGEWDQAARLADGEYFNIDQDKAEVAIAAPQDDRISELNQQLNETYVAYGAVGATRKARQVAQDANASSLAPTAAAERAQVKSSANYRNEDWDLVDAVGTGTIELEVAEEELLPEVMHDMTVEQRVAYVSEQAQKRKAIQQEIQALSADRAAFVAEERERLGGGADDTFGAAVRNALRDQLSESGYVVPAE